MIAGLDRIPKPLRRIAAMIAVLCTVLLSGSLGFHWIEGESLFDSFYMTLITLTTVGYTETIELSPAGRHFNALLILTGFCVVFVALGMLSQTLLQLEMRDYFGRRKAKRMIDNLSNHYIVCGLGRVGRNVVQQLRREGTPFVAIDNSPEGAQWAKEHEVLLLAEDATLDETLTKAGAERAKGLVAAISSDAECVYVTLTASGLNPDLRIVARATTEAAKKQLANAGAHVVISPYRFTGFRMVQALVRPQVSKFLDIASTIEEADIDLDVEEYAITEGSPFAGETLAGSRLTERLDVIVLAITQPDRELRFNPTPDTRLRAGDVLIVMGRRTTLFRMQRELEH